MPVLTLPYHDISPIAIDFGYFSIKWYGLAYMAGFMLGWFYIKRLLSTDRLWAGKPPMAPEKVDDMLFWIAVGVVAGGRLGYVFLYELSSFLHNPLMAIEIWNGGMSFHGGLLGTTLAIILFSRRNGISIFSTGDLVAAAVPIGIFFGRIANFINGGLYGRPSNLPWAMDFPHDNPDVPRHPSQIYEAIIEGIIIFFVLRFFIYNRDALHSPGKTAGLFLILYGIGRFLVENFRQPEIGHALNIGPLTAGMVYSIPMIAVGVAFVYYAQKSEKRAA